MWVESQDFDVDIGETWTESLVVYTDDTQTATEEVLGDTVQLIITPEIATASSVYAVTVGANGVVSWIIQTAGWEPGVGRWALKITDLFNNVTYPAQGALFANEIEMLSEGAPLEVLEQPTSGIDGGTASSQYSLGQSFDGGSAASVLVASQSIDGGNA